METIEATGTLADAPAAVATTGTDFNSFVSSAPNELKDLFNKNGVKDFDTLAKSYNGLNSMLGKKGLVKPGDDAPEAEKEAYTKSLYKEIGVPEDGKYEYALPEVFTTDYKDHVDQEFLDKLTGVAAANGVNAKAMQEIVNTVMGEYAEMIADSKGDFSTLKNEWGTEFDGKVALAHQAYKTGLDVNDPRVKSFEQKFGNDPDAVYAFAKLAEKIGIKSDTLQGPTQQSGVGKAELTQQAVAKTQAAMDAIKNNKYHEAEKLQAESRELYARASTLSN